MSFTSMTDVQRQARYGRDKEPYLDAVTGARYAFYLAAHIDFDPRPKCIPSPDPEPWLNRRNYQWVREATPFRAGHHRLAIRPWGSFTPDPEFVRSEANPILESAREAVATLSDMPGWTSVDVIESMLFDLDEWLDRVPSDQVESARRVLTRLRDVMEASK